MSTRRRWICVLAMVAAFGGLSCSAEGSDATSGSSEPTTSEEPGGSETQAPSPATSGRSVLEGHIVGNPDHPGYTVRVPEGWSTQDGGFMVKRTALAIGMSVWDVGEVPRDPCSWKGTEVKPGPTVDDLVRLLTSQRFRNPTEPTPVTLARREGTYLELSVPDDWVVTGDADFEGCDDPGNGHNDFVSWWGKDDGERYEQAAGQVDRLWILDVEGQTLLVDATFTPDATSADRAELEDVVSSLRFAKV
jgi:hypothetical protein